MNECVIACETLRNELEHCAARANRSTEIFWIESGLHNTPGSLHDRLQKTLDELKGFARVLLCFGFCGNSVLGLRTGDFELIVPRVDDCISLLLGSLKLRRDLDRRFAAYYLTEGWMSGEQNILSEYEYCVRRYGEKTAKDISTMMYAHYRTLGLLDTGYGDVRALLESTRQIAQTLELEQEVFPATTDYLTQLILGPWPDCRFLTKGPHSAITESDVLLA
jgi:hypothetical protein